MNRNSQRIVLAGGSGFLGSILASHFLESGWEVIILTRHPRGSHRGIREVHWDGCNPGRWCNELEGAMAVINLTLQRHFPLAPHLEAHYCDWRN